MAQKFIVPITIKQLASASSDALTVSIDGDSYGRVKIEAGGRLSWGDGGGTFDTNLFRESANTLATDDVLKATAGVITMAVAGVPSAALANGALAVDTTNNAFYFRSNNAWNQVTGGGGASVTVSDSAPASPDSGDLWFDSTSLEMFIYYGSAWVQLNADTGAEELSDLLDIEFTNLTANQILKYNGESWVNGNGSSTTVSDTAPATPESGDLWYDSTSLILFIYYSGNWIELNPDTGAEELSDLTDINVTNPVDGQVLKYNGTEWVNDSDSSGTSINSIDDINDVTIASLANGQFLKYNGSAWVNDAIDLGTDTTGSYVQSLVAGTGVTLTNNSGESATPTIAIGQDVATNSNVTFNNLTVAGNLTVSGTTTSISTETVTIDDNIIVLNNNATGAPSVDAGIEIERGSSTNVLIRWNETTDKWQFTNDGSTYSDLGAGGASVSSSAPASPTSGALWFNQDTAQTFVYYGSVWIEVGAVSNGARVEVSASAPASPATGDLWFDSDTAQTFAYYDSQWVEIGASGMAASIGDTAPTSPVSGQIWFDSTNASTNVYYDSHWVEVGGTTEVFNFIDAKGDLIVGTADNTVDNLAVGTNGQVLTADSTTATGLKWSTPTVYQEVVANVSNTEIGYLDGVTSLIQTQLDAKQAIVSGVSNTEIGYLDGVTSAIQTQIDTKASTGKAIAMAIVFG